MLPLFAPSLVQALAFIYVFGNNGIFTRATGYNVGIYGAKGIVVAEVFYCFRTRSSSWWPRSPPPTCVSTTRRGRSALPPSRPSSP